MCDCTNHDILLLHPGDQVSSFPERPKGVAVLRRQDDWVYALSCKFTAKDFYYR